MTAIIKRTFSSMMLLKTMLCSKMGEYTLEHTLYICIKEHLLRQCACTDNPHRPVTPAPGDLSSLAGLDRPVREKETAGLGYIGLLASYI